MKKAVSLLLVLLFMNLMNPLAAAATVRAARRNQQETQTVAAKLSNKDVLDMLKTGLSSEVVIAKIKSSPSNFDTSPTALQELKAANVPDAVILAMVQASTPVQAAVADSPAIAADAVTVKVPDGTEIEIQLKNNLSGQEAKIGDLVDFTVLRPVQIGGITVIEKDASARARVTTAKKAGRWGKAGKIEWAMQDVQAVDGSRLPARFSKRAVGDSSGGTVAVAAVATTVLLGPVGLLWGLKKGKAAVIPAGNRYSVFVSGDTTVKARPTTQQGASTSPQ
jgi:hypothetical protein